MIRKNVLITAGPTNEPIDQVMQITNMSSGRLGAVIADHFVTKHSNFIGTLYYVCHKRAVKPESDDPRIEIVPVETTDQMLEAITEICETTKIDVIIHSAAVGDYKGRHVVRAADVAKEIYDKLDGIRFVSDIIDILENPECLCDSSTKISSYEPSLMCMLELTTKIIGHLRDLAPDAKIVGFKLLHDVNEEELETVALELARKNRLDYIVANDLSKIGYGYHPAKIMNDHGYKSNPLTKPEIAEELGRLMF